MPNSALLTLSLVCSFAAYPAYAYAIGRQGTRPTRPTWIMILVSDLLLFSFMLMEARWDWLLLGFTAGNVMMLGLMAAADLKAGRGRCDRNRDWWATMMLGRDRWTGKDIASVAVALAALALFAVSGSGLLSICFCLMGKIAASIPMWVNLWKEPEREALLPWVLWLAGGMLYVAAIPSTEWSVVSLATPVVFVVLEAIVLAFLCRRYLRVAVVSSADAEFRKAA
ncbi:MAG: hypothetical protein HC841_06685 [Verrucomicrobiae bacterium]|nr:hypothetical protein [Verrucomicrobiae bacterium]